MTLHEKIKWMRMAKKLTQREVADAIFVARSTYGDWERGLTEPNVAQLKKLSVFFKVSVDLLIHGHHLML